MNNFKSYVYTVIIGILILANTDHCKAQTDYLENLKFVEDISVRVTVLDEDNSMTGNSVSRIEDNVINQLRKAGLQVTNYSEDFIEINILISSFSYAVSMSVDMNLWQEFIFDENTSRYYCAYHHIAARAGQKLTGIEVKSEVDFMVNWIVAQYITNYKENQ